jgi:hypothetical protein
LERPPYRRAELQRIDPPDDARELNRQRLLEPRLYPFTLLHAGDDHRLCEEVVQELNIERQVESYGAL